MLWEVGSGAGMLGAAGVVEFEAESELVVVVDADAAAAGTAIEVAIDCIWATELARAEAIDGADVVFVVGFLLPLSWFADTACCLFKIAGFVVLCKWASSGLLLFFWKYNKIELNDLHLKSFAI